MTNNLFGSRTAQFWAFQIIFWLGLAIITFFSLTLWYGTFEWSHVMHILMQALLGMFFTLPLRRIFSYLWEKPAIQRIAISLIATAIAASIWTSTRMLTFIWLTHEENLWADFGGWYFGGFFIFLGWTALYYVIRYYQLMRIEVSKRQQASAILKTEQLKRLKAESTAKEAQLKMLRYQLNPHFLHNTLNAIYALIKLEDSTTAMRMTQQLSKFLRYSLDSDPGQLIELNQEIEALQLFLDIEQTRFSDRLSVEFDIDPNTESIKIPSLLLQPLIENAIKYAIAPSEEGGSIRITAKLTGQQLYLEVSDNGPGITCESDQLPPGRGVGLINTRERIKTLYGDDSFFELTNAKPTGLKVIIRIPLESSMAPLMACQKSS